MLRPPALLLLAALLASALPAAAKTDGPDFVVTLTPGNVPVFEGPEGLAALVEVHPGERYAWNLTLTQEYTVGEFRVQGAFDVERVEQATPMLENVPEDRYPLFHLYPDERPWEAEGPVQVYRYVGAPPDFALRLGFPGAGNVTLALFRDVTPPAFTVDAPTSVTHIGFYQESRTDEPAVANLRVRPVAGGEWVENPTPTFHYRQRFPIQGLRADTEYEAQLVFTDFAGNQATAPSQRIRTAPTPIRPMPVISDLEPAPNATLPNGSVVLRARVASPESPLEGGSARFFFDKREQQDGFALVDGVFEHRPPILDPGKHSASLEVTNAAGGKAVALWTFHVEGPAPRTPGPAPVAILLVGLAVALVLRRAR